MKKANIFLIFCICLGCIACNDDDLTNTSVPPIVPSEIWPLQTFNNWSFAADTIPLLVRIDSSFTNQNHQLFLVSGFNQFIVPEIFSASQSNSLLYTSDSIYFLEMPETALTIANQEVKVTSFTLPILNGRTQADGVLEFTSNFQQIYADSVVTATVTTSSETIEQNVLEAVGGYVFTNVIKIKNTYVYSYSDQTLTFDREIWFQPGVGPIKIVDKNKNLDYLIVSYQFFQNDAEF